MGHTIIVTLHIVGAVGALITGLLAFVYPNGTWKHRIIGKTYLAMWVLLAVCGYGLGWQRPGISIFEIATGFGVLSTIYAYAMVLFRRRIGRVWLQRHYNWMLASLTAVVVATVNQMLPRLGLEYPLWVFILMCAAPIVVNPFFQRRLDRRYGFAKKQAPRQAEVNQAA